MKGYDYAVLESYQRYITSVANAMGLEVSNGWAVPPQHFQVQRFKPQSAVSDSEYKLTLYERTIQVSTRYSAPNYPFLNRNFLSDFGYCSAQLSNSIKIGSSSTA